MLATQNKDYSRIGLKLRLRFTFFSLCSLFFLILLTGCHHSQYSYLECLPCPPKPRPIKNVEVAVALGTGGFRGVAHLGVLEVLEKEGVPIDLVVGSSAGSMVGAFYCDNPNMANLKHKCLAFKKSDVFGLFKSPGCSIEEFMDKQLRAKTFEQLKIPLVAVATNLKTNQMTLLRSGPIAPAIHASSALPHICAPVCLYSQVLTDGGVLQPVPVRAARMFNPKMVIAVNTTPQAETTPLKGKHKILFRAIEVSFFEYAKLQSCEADVDIHPDLFGYGTFDDKCNHEAYEAGKRAALEALPYIREEMKRRNIQPRVRRR